MMSYYMMLYYIPTLLFCYDSTLLGSYINNMLLCYMPTYVAPVCAEYDACMSVMGVVQAQLHAIHFPTHHVC